MAPSFSSTDLHSLASLLKALAEPKRLAILDQLMKGVQCNCELGSRLQMAPNLISHHLNVLRQAGLVHVARHGSDARWLFYSINEETLDRLQAMLGAFLDFRRVTPLQEECCQGQDQDSKTITGLLELKMSKPEQEKRKVLFLCTGNSCRSQMAEAIVNHCLGSEWEAFSAGTQPAGYVHPLALRVLEEIGINHQGRSKQLDEFRDAAFDMVVTVCDDAAENCPLWLGSGKRVHIGFADPAKVVGTDEEKMAAFRSLRESMTEKMPALCQEV